MADPTRTSGTLPTVDLGARVSAVHHPIYDTFRDEWIQLGDVREGTGGFRDGTYLVAHPREWEDHTATSPKKPTKKLKARRTLARYDNLADAILEAKKSALFRESPNRRIGTSPPAKDAKPAGLAAWWQDVDGLGTHIDDAMPAWWDLAATFGHMALYFDLPETQAETAADQGQPYVRIYTPLDIVNWLTDDDGCITSIKVVEAVQPADYQQTATTYRIRVIDEQGWQLYDFKSGTPISQGEHHLGRLPVVFLYGKRRAVLSDVGQSVLGDPRMYIDLYNLTSEKRELLRNQTFSFINLPLGSGPDAMTVEQAKALLGEQIGTGNVLFSGLQAQMLSADASNVTAYQEDIKDLKREIYRVTGVQWESDSKDAEAQGSLMLKREEMNTRLSQYADECQAAEYALADLWYRMQYGADDGPAKLDKDEVTIQYPEKFNTVAFDDVLKQVQAAQSVGMPPIFLKALRKTLVTKFEGMANLPPAELKAIQDAIDAAQDDVTPAEAARQRLDATMLAAKSGKKLPADPKAVAA